MYFFVWRIEMFCVVREKYVEKEFGFSRFFYYDLGFGFGCKFLRKRW